jgi:sulfofructose kinase
MQPLVAAIGQATVDIVGVVPRLPDVDSRVELSEVSLQGGGAAATAVATAAALGCRGRLAARVAGDSFGKFIVGGLREAGVDCEYVLGGPGHLSGLTFVAVTTGCRRATFFTRGDVTPLTLSDVPLDAFLQGISALVVDGYEPDLQIDAAERCRDTGIPVFFDACTMLEGVPELVALSDYLLASNRFITEAAPRGELEDSLAELAEMGPRAVIVTLGRAGSVGLADGKVVRQPAHEVAARDGTGAGDVYLGAFASAVVRGLPFDRAMELASAAAALKCQSLGSLAGIPDLDEVTSFLAGGRR